MTVKKKISCKNWNERVQLSGGYHHAAGFQQVPTDKNEGHDKDIPLFSLSHSTMFSQGYLHCFYTLFFSLLVKYYISMGRQGYSLNPEGLKITLKMHLNTI